MKDRYASNSILLLALNKINCYFQSSLHRNVKLCRKSNEPLPAANKHQTGECHQLKTDVDQETTQHLAETKHVADEMSATNHQTNYLYKRNASYVIEITRAKYKHWQTTKHGILFVKLRI